MDPQALLMQMMGHEQAHPTPNQPLGGISLSEGVDWEGLARRFELSPDEIQVIASQPLDVQAPEAGPSLVERLERLRPGVRSEDVEVFLTGRGVEGTIRW